MVKVAAKAARSAASSLRDDALVTNSYPPTVRENKMKTTAKHGVRGTPSSNIPGNCCAKQSPLRSRPIVSATTAAIPLSVAAIPIAARCPSARS